MYVQMSAFSFIFCCCALSQIRSGPNGLLRWWTSHWDPIGVDSLHGDSGETEWKQSIGGEKVFPLLAYNGTGMLMCSQWRAREKKNDSRVVKDCPMRPPPHAAYDQWKCSKGSAHLGTLTFLMYCLGENHRKFDLRRNGLCARKKKLLGQRGNKIDMTSFVQ